MAALQASSLSDRIAQEMDLSISDFVVTCSCHEEGETKSINKVGYFCTFVSKYE